MISLRLSAVLIVLAASVTVGCRGKRVQCPADFVMDANALLTQHDAPRAGIRSLKAEARVEQWGHKTRIRGTVFLFLEAPDRVRFDVMSQLGPVSVLTSDGSQFQLLDQRGGQFVEGPTCPDNIARLLGIALEPTEVFRLLTGSVPRLPSTAEVLHCKRGDRVVQRDLAGGAVQRITFAPPKAGAPAAAPRLKHVEVLDAKGERQWRVDLGDYRDFEVETGEVVSLPRRVRFRDALRKTDTEIRLKTLQVNADVPADAFQQVAPGGIQRQYAPCD